LQKEDQNNLYSKLEDVIPKSVLTSKNKAKTWKYGYDPKYDIVIISKTGEIGDIIVIQNLRIALPKNSKDVYKRSSSKSNQYWEREELPKELGKIQSIFQWNERSSEFKNRWVDYIEEEFDRRDDGMWFMSNGVPTYITGSHYMYLQWTSIDVGYP